MSYHIMSLSGGGMRGIFQAVCLREIAKLLRPIPLNKYFDLIAGTSTGSILSFGIALGVDPERIVELYRQHGSTIFAHRWVAKFRKGPRYLSEPLRNALIDVFGARKLKECETDVLITATTLNRFQIRIFTTLDRKDVNVDKELSVVDVIMASCAAPTFFAPVRPTGGERDYVDGGMWANSPSLAAVIEAYHCGKASFDDIRLVTIGNGIFPEGAIAEEFKKLRTVSPEMINSILNMMFATQSHMAECAIARLMSTQNVIVLDTELPRIIDLDDAPAAIKILPAMAEIVAHNQFNRLKQFLRPGLEIKNLYFDGTDRDFLADLHYSNGYDSKGTDFEKTDLVRLTSHDNAVRAQRTTRNYRGIISIIRYQTGIYSNTDRQIPRDVAPEVQGQYSRYIAFDFRARVEGEPHNVVVRLRDSISGAWLKVGSSDKYAERNVKIDQPAWETKQGILGPVRADQSCSVTFDVNPGPSGDGTALYIKDLLICEIRHA